MNVTEINERSLLQKARQFDENALSEIYDIYSPMLYRYAMRMLGNQQITEDCISETFLRYLKALHNGLGPSDHLQSYLYRIAHNWIVDFYRSTRINEEELKEEIPPTDDSVEEQVIQNLETHKIRQAVVSLTVEQQQVITLKYLEGWDNDEIARHLGKKSGAIRGLLFRAMTALKEIVVKKEKTDVPW